MNTILLIIILLLVLLLLYKCEKFTINNNNVPFKIDIVYTWAGENDDKKNIKTSFNNELKYSLRSVFKYLPWINHIYIIINSPLEENKPSWFNDKYHNKITLVDQKEIFPKNKHSELPCKVADIIETYIHLIPGLSEHFIYMNDDFFINKKLKYTSFFSPNGKIIINKDNSKSKKMTINKYDNRNYPFILDKIIPWHQHVPYNITISSRKEFINKYSDWIKFIRSRNYKKRDDLGICSYFLLNKNCLQIHGPYFIWMYNNNMAIVDNNYNEYYITTDFTNIIYKIRFKYLNNKKFFVLNNVDNKYKNDITKLLNNKYPNKLYFEK